MNQATVLSMKSAVLTPCLMIKIHLSILSSPVSTALLLFHFQENITGNSDRFVADVEFTLVENIAFYDFLKCVKEDLFTRSDF